MPPVGASAGRARSRLPSALVTRAIICATNGAPNGCVSREPLRVLETLEPQRAKRRTGVKRTRVHDLAKEFGTTSDAILRLLWGRGFFVRSASSRVDAFAVEWLRFEFTIDSPTLPPAPAHVPLRKPGLRSVRPIRHRTREWSSWREPSTNPSSWRPPYRQSTRTVPVFGAKSGDLGSLDLAAIVQGLIGSPYSLPAEQSEYLVTSFLPRAAALSIRARRETQRVSLERKAMLRRITGSTEIYESNRIEGLGPDLATTDRVLHLYDLDRRTDISIAHQAIERCLIAEPMVRDVVGLGAARMLAEVFCADRTRTLTESDVRELHELILVDDPQRGSYKRYVNRIEGSEHVPTAPSDTPAAMAELMTWLASTTLAPLWRAAVAHAWLTHIHPFHDGNGRIARLLSNLILIREGFPPLIVRASADKGAYLDALAASDEGGDILPLARTFRRVLSRGVQDLSNPELADRVFDTEIAKQSAPRHVRWNRLLAEFLSELAPRLLLHRLNLHYIGEVTDAELLRIGSGRPENAWIAKVTSPSSNRDLLLHVAAPTSFHRRYMADAEVTPSIFVSVRNERPLDARQYLPVGYTTFTYEFTPLVDTESFVLRRGNDRLTLPTAEAANASADHLYRAYRQLIGRP